MNSHASEESRIGDIAARLETLDALPLAQRAAEFERLHDDLLAELQRGDHDAS